MPQSAPSNDPLRPPPPRRVGWLVAVLLIVALAVLGYANRGRLQQWTQAWMGHTAAVPTAASAPAKTSSAAAAPSSAPQPAASVAPVASAPLQLPASTASLPALHHSDATVLQELGALLGKPGLAWLVPRHLILHFVATVDNLTRQTVPQQVWPVHPVPGVLRTTGQGVDLAIAPDNARRYAPYVQMLTAISPQRAAQLYVQLYPLCEQAWRELGHPKSAFNDRLLAVIANLLQAPEPQGAVLLRQPKVLYTYADPALEAAPAGQKILMRMGLENERAVKDWLRQFRQDLRAQMQPAATAPSPAQ
ncbi:MULTISPECIES: DUF3014 domain-containing protein [Thiomonas]|uniref:DUF3014 domain-containing protein n=1 Tax=Thiomonas arsenitoxydans (strain DSM 22701 / CIP 110005 / 3As) TaxID=426114 RepID=A0A8I1SX46_THIA3|nr:MULTISPECIES: DUF3014 domain-containing protein [Thiomonas]CQR43222.1 conserved hypothetical protein [Thiomonas sp. CB3]MBN8744171.1 DUF3014 domain-containing protein [Thiomonas arsenitoxydans]MDD4999719.1 DUF3014 domain-containing protein [Thiomonas arsenitoxydans]ODU95126.1 MAG: hypothetical protein ABT24_12470 [Thiomonas sp. SCN 64-16]CDW93861.1 conserved hypothetical protein [Thiomonas sp. CB2]